MFDHYKGEFLVDATDLHPSSAKRVKTVCDICGKTVELAYYHYIQNINNNKKYVCQSCSVSVRHEKELDDRQKYHYDRLVKSCNEKEYKLLSKQDEIKSNTSYIRYKCIKHGEQSMRVANMINGKGCPLCNHDMANALYKKSLDAVLDEVNRCGGTLLNPEDYVNSTKRNLKFVCSECGNVFITSFRVFTQHGGMVCENCRNHRSLGEKKIKTYLEKKNINYEEQKWFKDCRDKKPLPFDFYLPDLNIMIEFDGIQHFVVKDSYFKHGVEYIKLHDNIKNDYCKQNKIKLIRIPYYEINNIDGILDKELFT